jgi:hypothetical protein
VEAGGDDVAAEGEAAVTVVKRPVTVKPMPATETAVARASAAAAAAVAVAPTSDCRGTRSTEHLAQPIALDSTAKAAGVPRRARMARAMQPR